MDVEILLEEFVGLIGVGEIITVSLEKFLSRSARSYQQMSSWSAGSL